MGEKLEHFVGEPVPDPRRQDRLIWFCRMCYKSPLGVLKFVRCYLLGLVRFTFEDEWEKVKRVDWKEDWQALKDNAKVEWENTKLVCVSAILAPVFAAVILWNMAGLREACGKKVF